MRRRHLHILSASIRGEMASSCRTKNLNRIRPVRNPAVKSWDVQWTSQHPTSWEEFGVRPCNSSVIMCPISTDNSRGIYEDKTLFCSRWADAASMHTDLRCRKASDTTDR